MAVHVIREENFGMMRELVWDDERGTVEGDHPAVERVQALLAEPTPLDLSADGLIVILDDPAHDPRDFLHCLGPCYWTERGRAALPDSLRDVKPTEGRPAPPPTGVIDGLERPLIPGVEFVW